MKLYVIKGRTYKLISKIRGLRRILLWEQKERLITNKKGTNDQTAYIIRWMNGDYVGLMGMFRYVLFHLAYAEEQGYIPIIDWQNYSNPYLETDKIGLENAWEYYFKQPTKYSLKNIEELKKIKLSWAQSIEDGKDEFSEMNYLAVGKYIVFSEKIENRIMCEMKNIYHKYGLDVKILGLKLRGTDYISTRAKKHRVQPTVEYAIEIIDQCVNEWGTFGVCFLATEDESIVNGLRKRYGNWIYVLADTNRLQSDEKWYENKNMSTKKEGENYCIEIGLLSRCDALIASGSNGTTVAMLLNQKKYEHVHLIDLGVYE